MCTAVALGRAGALLLRAATDDAWASTPHSNWDNRRLAASRDAASARRLRAREAELPQSIAQALFRERPLLILPAEPISFDGRGAAGKTRPPRRERGLRLCVRLQRRPG